MHLATQDAHLLNFYFQIGEQTVRRVVGGRVRVPAGPTVGAEIRRS